MKIVIFGIGSAGRAILRRYGALYEVVAYIENNAALHGTTYADIPIQPVSSLHVLEFDRIAMGGVWIDEMKEQLINMGISEEKIWLVEDTELKFTSQERQRNTDMLIKEFARLMNDAAIPYFIEGSALLCLLRGQDLSEVPDVDVLITSHADIEKTWDLISKNELFKTQRIEKIIYTKDRPLTRKGQTNRITIKSSEKIVDQDPVIFDINWAVDIGNYYILDYIGDAYHYYSKKFVGEGRFVDYKTMSLQVPERAEDYVAQAYGSDWRMPARKWTTKDYGNLLVSNDDLMDFIDKQRQ